MSGSPTRDAGPSRYGWHSGDDAMFRCEKEYVFKHLRRVTKAGIRETPRAKAVGLLFHAGRARWFRDGFLDVWDSIYAAVREEAERQPLPIPQGAEQEALNILSQYVAYYGPRPHPKVLAAELELGPLATSEGSQELHTIRLDDISIYPDFGNALADGEAKTTSGKPSAVYAHYNANHGQMLKQMLVTTKAVEQGKLKLPREPIGIVLDVVQKGYGGDKCHFERFLITIEPYQLEWFAQDLERKRQRRRQLEKGEALGYGNYEPQPPRRNPTACRRLVSGDGGQFIAVDCEFINLCKFGGSARTEYVVNGQPGAAVRGEWWK